MDLTAKQRIPVSLISGWPLIVWNGIFFNHNYLESFNFGLNFIHWVTTFYKNIETRVINNGITSSYFTILNEKLGKEIHSLFVVAVETLAISPDST